MLVNRMADHFWSANDICYHWMSYCGSGQLQCYCWWNLPWETPETDEKRLTCHELKIRVTFRNCSLLHSLALQHWVPGFRVTPTAKSPIKTAKWYWSYHATRICPQLLRRVLEWESDRREFAFRWYHSWALPCSPKLRTKSSKPK